VFTEKSFFMTTTDAQNKKLANEADKSASDAKYDAKQARKAASSLDDFQKDVANLKSKIAADKSKLSSLSGNNHNSVPYNQFARKQTMNHIIP
jgi:uncharacterized protein YlxW (UPF0749 family)